LSEDSVDLLKSWLAQLQIWVVDLGSIWRNCPAYHEASSRRTG